MHMLTVFALWFMTFTTTTGLTCCHEIGGRSCGAQCTGDTCYVRGKHRATDNNTIWEQFCTGDSECKGGNGCTHWGSKGAMMVRECCCNNGDKCNMAPFGDADTKTRGDNTLPTAPTKPATNDSEVQSDPANSASPMSLTETQPNPEARTTQSQSRDNKAGAAKEVEPSDSDEDFDYLPIYITLAVGGMGVLLAALVVAVVVQQRKKRSQMAPNVEKEPESVSATGGSFEEEVDAPRMENAPLPDDAPLPDALPAAPQNAPVVPSDVTPALESDAPVAPPQ